MRRGILGALGVLVFAGVSLPARPAGAKVEFSIFKLRAGSLSADFEDATDDACIVTQTHIQFSEAVIFLSGTPPTIQPPTTQVSIIYSNACTGEYFELDGGTAQQSFQIAGDLGKASLIATVPVSDDSGTNNANVSVNVTWTANAPLQRVKSTTVTHDARSVTVDRTDVEARTADVVGPVSAVLMIQAGPTFFDLSRFPEGGQLGKDNEGSRTITFLGNRRN
ncbi:MAG TPA: hypothetical protein VHL80_08865 [Polyangia bacterium]|nr:hypothetical protein [Polyangia bacterium]